MHLHTILYTEKKNKEEKEKPAPLFGRRHVCRARLTRPVTRRLTAAHFFHTTDKHPGSGHVYTPVSICTWNALTTLEISVRKKREGI